MRRLAGLIGIIEKLIASAGQEAPRIREELSRLEALGARLVSDKKQQSGRSISGRGRQPDHGRPPGLVASSQKTDAFSFGAERVKLRMKLKSRGGRNVDWKSCEFRARSIGVVHSPFREAAGTPIQAAMAGDAEGCIEVLDKFAPGLKDLEGFERIWLLYWFDRAQPNGELIVTPYLDSAPRGVFSTRAPSRPNPIGISCVRLLGIKRNTLRVQGIDVLDGTPVLDIKPYVPRFDCFEGVRAGWIDTAESGQTVADSRFERKRL